MHVAVLGAGVVGVTTAYYLTKAGHKVTVIDGADSVAAGCSFANGSQLSYSYTDAMATPAFLLKIPRILAGLDRGVRFRAPLSDDLLRWGIAFLAQCTSRKSVANTLATLEMAQRSRVLLAELRRDIAPDFSYRTAGKLVLLGSRNDVDNAKRICDLKIQRGCDIRVVSTDEACTIEPAIEKMTGNYKGAVYSPGDDAGDARAFTASLAAFLDRSASFRLRLRTTIDRLVGDRHAIRGVSTSDGIVDADAVVVCLGATSPSILKPFGVKTRILPTRGYSVTLPKGAHANSVSVTDPASRFVIGRNNGKMRIAGFADFVGFRTSQDRRRIEQLVALARTRAPFAADYEQFETNRWGGFRPLTPDGRPLVGATRVAGLYLNTGHGSLGWTLACASAEQLTNAIESPVQPLPRRRDAADPLDGLRSSYTR